MKHILLLIAILVSFQGKSCGLGPNEYYYFYNLFSQTNIIPKAYHQFIHGPLFENYKKYGKEIPTDYGNQELWKQLSKNDKAVKKYWEYVNSFNHLPFTFTNNSWDYNEIISYKIEPESYIDNGFKLFNSEQNIQLKTRYAYQIVKLMFYSRRYNDAIKFFDNFVLPLNEKNEIFYYTMNLVGGCHYRLENYEKAAYYYILVFYNSIDKKHSAFVSYDLCTNRYIEGKTFMKYSEEKEAYITLKSIRSFSDSFFGLEELYKLNPKSDFIELLFVRSLYTIEKNTLHRINIESKYFLNADTKTKQRIKKLLDFSKIMFEKRKVKDKNFWILAYSYLNFLNGNTHKAKLFLNLVTDKRFEEQKKILALVYKVFSWKRIGEKEEKYLMARIKNKTLFNHNQRSKYNDWDDIIWEQISHLYISNNELAKSYLVNNSIESIERIFSLPLIDNMIKFIKKTKKSEFELYLSKNEIDTNAIGKLLYAKGLYYLHLDNPQKALEFFNKDDYKNPDYWILFSNNITKPIFTLVNPYENPIPEIMTDSVCKSSVFSFIKNDLSEYDIAVDLIKLDSLTYNSKKWKRKLAHYLLGNYYLNISNSGVFKWFLVNRYPDSPDRKYFYSPDRKRIFTDEMIADRTAYNLTEANVYLKLYHGYAKKAMKHYKQVLALSNDKELNARTLYMMAKCELNDMYNSNDKYYDEQYDGTVNKNTKKYKKSFEKLKSEYSDTKFYEMIIEECSFFKYYCTL